MAYTKQNFQDGEVLTAAQLNHMEDGIKAASEIPTIGENGNWWINGEDTGVDATPEDGATPEIGSNGNWWINGVDTGISATPADGLTPHIGEGGHWYIGQTDTGVRAEGRDGATGMLPLNDLSASSNNQVTLPANSMTIIEGVLIESYSVYLNLGERVEGYDNEWGMTFHMGETVHGVYFPTTRWPLGIAPTFAANTTTVIRWYYVGDTLCGEWVTV